MHAHGNIDKASRSLSLCTSVSSLLAKVPITQTTMPSKSLACMQHSLSHHKAQALAQPRPVTEKFSHGSPPLSRGMH